MMMGVALLLSFLSAMAMAKTNVMNNAPLVGYAVDINKVSVFGDAVVETNGRLKPLLKAEALSQCLMDMRNDKGQSTVSKTSISRSAEAFADKMGGDIDAKLVIGGLKASLKGSMANSKEKSDESTIIHVETRIDRGTVALDTMCLGKKEHYSAAFLSTISRLGENGHGLPEYYFESERDLWMSYLDFLSVWGTHVITAAKVGFSIDAVITQISKVSTDTEKMNGEMEISFTNESEEETEKRLKNRQVPDTLANRKKGLAAGAEGNNVGEKVLDALKKKASVKDPTEKKNKSFKLIGKADKKKSDLEKKTELHVAITINGGGIAEATNLHRRATELYSDPKRAEAIANGDPPSETPSANAGVDAFNVAMMRWVQSCNNGDTARVTKAVYTPWTELLKSGSIATHPRMLQDLERAIPVFLLLEWRADCPIGSWDTRAMRCDINHNDGKVLGKERYIKTNDGKYARYNPDTKQIDLIDSAFGATKFIFTRKGAPFDRDVRYGLRIVTAKGEQSLFSVNRKDLFETAEGKRDIKSVSQFIVTSKGAIALVPTRAGKSGGLNSYRDLTAFMQRKNSKLILTHMAHEPDHDGDGDDMNFFYQFEDPDVQYVHDGRGGNFYRGQQRNGKWHGNGRLQWGDGNMYKGGWSDGLFHGDGNLILAASGQNVRYDGGFFEGTPHGAGRLTTHSIEVGSLRWMTNTLVGRWLKGAFYCGYEISKYDDAVGEDPPPKETKCPNTDFKLLGQSPNKKAI